MMSMISDLVKKLRWIADYDQYQNRNSEVTIRKAADTIEMLSQKARATEQGWIPCSERLPSEFKEGEMVLATTVVDGLRVVLMLAVDVERFYLKGYVYAWMPLPKP